MTIRMEIEWKCSAIISKGDKKPDKLASFSSSFFLALRSCDRTGLCIYLSLSVWRWFGSVQAVIWRWSQELERLIFFITRWIDQLSNFEIFINWLAIIASKQHIRQGKGFWWPRFNLWNAPGRRKEQMGHLSPVLGRKDAENRDGLEMFCSSLLGEAIN